MSPFPPVSYAQACVVVVLGVLSALPLSSAVNPGAELAGPLIELPEFFVTEGRDLPPPESWLHAGIPGFEILTNASEARSRRLIRDFQLFRQALGVVWPLPEREGPPTLLILAGRGGKFDEFVPEATMAGPDQGRASLFLSGGGRSAIVIDLESTEINLAGADLLAGAAPGADASRLSIDHNKQLYREYIRHLLSRAQPRAPAWLEEGLAQLVMAMRFDRNTIVFGRVEDPNRVSAAAMAIAETNAAALADDPEAAVLPGAPTEDRDFNAALSRRALVPFEAFFAVGHDSPEALNPLGNNRWAKQAYAFVHMCLYGRGGRYQQAFADFLLETGRGVPVTEELFRHCFGMSYREMLLTLRGYIEFTDYKHVEFRGRGEGLAVPDAIMLREATQAEVGRIKAVALGLAGKSDEAGTELITPYIRGERDPHLLAALGLHERRAGRLAQSRKFLEAAAAAQVVEPWVYLELARQLRDEMIKGELDSGRLLTVTQMRTVLALLFTARSQSPAYPEVYELIAETWLQGEAAPQRANLAVLLEGVRLFPRRMSLIISTAELCVRNGMADEALALANFGLGITTDNNDRQILESLINRVSTRAP